MVTASFTRPSHRSVFQFATTAVSQPTASWSSSSLAKQLERPQLSNTPTCSSFCLGFPVWTMNFWKVGQWCLQAYGHLHTGISYTSWGMSMRTIKQRRNSWTEGLSAWSSWALFTCRILPSNRWSPRRNPFKQDQRNTFSPDEITSPCRSHPNFWL